MANKSPEHKKDSLPESHISEESNQVEEDLLSEKPEINSNKPEEEFSKVKESDELPMADTAPSDNDLPMTNTTSSDHEFLAPALPIKFKKPLAVLNKVSINKSHSKSNDSPLNVAEDSTSSTDEAYEKLKKANDSQGKKILPVPYKVN